jgi:hypothetical protein
MATLDPFEWIGYWPKGASFRIDRNSDKIEEHANLPRMPLAPGDGQMPGAKRKMLTLSCPILPFSMFNPRHP